jgi:uncharacterized ferritin-like protein (DUF455 family)
MSELRALALEALLEPSPMAKVAVVALLASAREQGRLELDATGRLTPSGSLPGRPDQPRLVHPRDVPRRGIGSPAGRGALYHALCHIEFNAINLALDAVWRFPGMPEQFYDDWLSVASEEAHHFCLLKDCVESLGVSYGDLPAHDGLWEAAEKTSGDLIARLALVPRTLEARGLDVTPSLRGKLSSIGDQRGAEVLDIVLRDEVGHVAIGNRWYRWCCERDRRDPLTAHAEVAHAYGASLPRGPFNHASRMAAGFTEAELAAWSTPLEAL